jgi:hypothetical protein
MRVLSCAFLTLFLLTAFSIRQVPAQEVTTVITIGGLDFNLKDSMPKALQGFAVAPGHVRKRLKFPASTSTRSIRVGIQALDDLIRTTPGKKIVLAILRAPRWPVDGCANSLMRITPLPPMNCPSS